MQRSDYPESYYSASAHLLAAQPPLRGSTHSEVVVVGAGICGLTTALELRQRGYEVSLIEAKRVGWGASGRSGGQILTSYACEMEPLKAQLGDKAARHLWEMSLEAVQLVRQHIAQHQIDCDWYEGSLTAAIKPRQVNSLREWQHSLEQEYQYPHLRFYQGEEMAQVINSQRYLAIVEDKLAGHLHPLNYTLGLAKAALAAGVKIYEQSPVDRLERGARPRIHCGEASISCDHLVLCGNAYLGWLVPELARKIMPVGTYIVATEVLGEERLRALLPGYHSVADTNFVLDYFRPTGDHRLLFGGRVSYSGIQPPDLASGLRRRMLKVFPSLEDAKVEHAWGGMVDITVNRAPHFGRLGQDNIYFAQGFSGHGMALTNLAGKVMAEAIAGSSERLDVFARLKHLDFPGGPWLRTPALVLGMLYYRLRDLL